MSHMGETGETRPLTAAEGLKLFAAQSAEQRRMWEEMRNLISERPQVMPLTQSMPIPPPAPTSCGGFINHGTQSCSHVNYIPMPTQAPPCVSHGVYPTAGSGHGTAVPLQSSSLMNVMANGSGLPVPVEPSAVVPEISRRMGATAWKQVVRDWEYPDRSRNHHTALEHWKHEWHASSRQSQLWGQRRTIALEFIEE